MGEQPGLFDIDLVWRAVTPAEPVEKPSPGRRLTQRQHDQVAAGYHPLTRGRLHPEATPDTNPDTPRDAPGRRCGNCRHRVAIEANTRTYPKCWYGAAPGKPPPRFSHSAATDVRAWWSACVDHEHPEET